MYAFGLQELSYGGSGTFTSQIDYYALAGHLIGSTNGTATTYYLTDAQGSVLTTLSASAIVGQQVYGPYGNTRYQVGSMGTTKGYTGQFHDAVSGLDYYHARYYDPVVGQFLSVDEKQGNVQGADPYSYVAGNPETGTDPTGWRLCNANGSQCAVPGGGGQIYGYQNCGSKCGIWPSSSSPTSTPTPSPKSSPTATPTPSPTPAATPSPTATPGTGGNGDGSTSDNKPKLPTHAQISQAQATAQQEATKLFSIAGGMLLLLANLPLAILKLEEIAQVTQILGDVAAGLLNWIGAAVLWTVSVAATAAATFIAGSTITLTLGSSADSLLAAMFEQRATDNNPNDWTPAALDQFNSQVDTFTGIVNTTSTILSVLTGKGIISKIIGALEPTTDVFYDFSGINDALLQMKENISV